MIESIVDLPYFFLMLLISLLHLNKLKTACMVVIHVMINLEHDHSKHCYTCTRLSISLTVLLVLTLLTGYAARGTGPLLIKKAILSTRQSRGISLTKQYKQKMSWSRASKSWSSARTNLLIFLGQNNTLPWIWKVKLSVVGYRGLQLFSQCCHKNHTYLL